jgi:tetratricopeptide (TPR) repeat protein
LIAALLAIALVYWRTDQGTQPRRSSVVYRDSPYRNTRPDVKYVGDAACVRCHAEIAETYRLHPMGRSLVEITPETAATDPNAISSKLFEAGGLDYSLENRDGHLIHVESRRARSGAVVGKSEAEVQYAVGCGRQAIGYLLERDGFLFQSPITWYKTADRWDLAPGFEKRNLHFERPIDTNCLFCHSNRSETVAGTLNRFEQPIFQGYSIGCERCHGPGSLHVERPAMEGGRDVTIVNPADLSPGLRDAVCEQCHLSGLRRIERLDRRNDDFRPGLPFQDFWIAFTAAGTTEKKFVGQVEQMHESRCFRASNARLGCISCHDPHKMPKQGEEAAYFRQRCLECHEQAGCRLPPAERLAQSREDSCIQCHMPRSPTADVFHSATTDHRILRRPDEPARPLVASAPPTSAEGRMVMFHRELMNEAERTEARREVGIALAQASEWPESAAEAIPLLEKALKARPDDALAWENKGIALGRLGRHEEAIAAFRKALKRDPDNESILATAATVVDKSGRHDDAVTYWRRAIAISPWRAEYHGRLAYALFQAHDWQEAAKESRAMLELSPADLKARELLIKCELRLKNQRAAAAEFKVLVESDPARRDQLIRQFPTLARELVN